MPSPCKTMRGKGRNVRERAWDGIRMLYCTGEELDERVEKVRK